MKSNMTRRQLGLVAAAAASGSPPDHSGDYASMSEFDPVHWTLEKYQSAPLRLTFRATNKTEAEAWQQQLRTKLVELLGGFPERTALNPRTLEIRELPQYRREKFIFESRPGVGVIGYLLTPSGVHPPYAPVVCIPGHGRGVDDIVGIDENGKDRTDKPGYQHDFALQVVERGLAAVAIEPMGFGYRRDPLTRKKGAECDRLPTGGWLRSPFRANHDWLARLGCHARNGLDTNTA